MNLPGERSTAADWLRSYQFSEHHEIVIEAGPEAVERALRSVSLTDMATARLLWRLRTLPARLLRRRRPVPAQSSMPLLDQIVRRGGIILVDRPGRIVAGLGGQFWRATMPLERFSTREEFVRWNAVDSCKSTIEFAWSDSAPVRLETTTLVWVPTVSARRRFYRYWLVVRHGSALTRILLLRAVKRRAEGEPAGEAEPSEQAPDVA